MKKRFSSNIDYYSNIAGAYDNAVKFCNGNTGILFRIAKPFLPELSGNKLLDIGCGTGLCSKPFARQGFKISGVDGAEGMLRVFSQKGFAEFLLRVDLEKEDFPFANASFDAAISNGVFCLFSSLDRVIGETGRVLKRGGIFCFTVEDVSKTEPRMIVRSGMDIYRHKPEYLASILSSAGFEIRAQKNYVDYHLLMDGAIVIFTAFLCRKK
jgi:predicted TPR repeat methyltransferase